jgi:8-oxo-dGTP pyrophosphatase MutT (NUDIX family)
MFRVPTTARGVEHPEILLIRRSPGRILPGLWQCVSGSLEPGERVTSGALRELAEETGFGAADIEAFYDLDLVTSSTSLGRRDVTSAVCGPSRPGRATPRTSTTARAGTSSKRRTSRSSGRATGRPSSASVMTCPSPSGPAGSS